MKKTYIVKDMKCAACETAIEKAVMQVPGISKVNALRREDKVIVTMHNEVKDKKIKMAIENAGYHVEEVVTKK